MRLFQEKFPLICGTYKIIRPYGRRRLLLVFLLLLLQGVFQIIGVSSIYPFLALAADPETFRNSYYGDWVLSIMPEMANDTLLFWAGVLAVSMLLLSNAANLLSEIGRVSYTRGLGHWLRVRLLRRIANRPYGYFLHRNSGELLKKIVTDVPAYVNGVVLQILEVVTRVITTILIVSFLIYLSPVVSVGATLFFGTVYGIAFLLLRGLRSRVSLRLKAANRGISKHANQLIGGIKPAKVHEVVDVFIKDFSSHSEDQAKAAAWVPIIGNGMRYLIEPLAFGGLVVLVLVLSGGQGSFASLVPTLGVMALAGYRLLPAVQGIYGSMNAISTHRHTVEEIEEEFRDEGSQSMPRKRAKRVEGGSSLPPLSRAIEARNIQFRYQGSTSAIFENLTFRIPAQVSFAIVGRTGTGKSTLVDLLLGLHAPTSGQIIVDGEQITQENASSWRTQVGYVPQDIFLLDGTIAANIAFGVSQEEVDPCRLRESAERAQILKFIEDDLPGGFDTLVGERGVRLSGGQKQRIGLARALYRRPRVLILDEATSSLDVDTEASLVDALEELHGELTMIVIAHRLSTIERCDVRLDLNDLVRSPNFAGVASPAY
jgi:ATP-binding cassette, subfamily B, bacterial PglK